MDPGKADVTTPVHSVCDNPDMRLVNVWLDLREFATAVNLAHQTQRKLSPGLFQEALISVQYRLQHLSYDGQDRHEILRATMLAASMTIFLEIRSIPVQYQHLARQLRAMLRSLKSHAHGEWLRLNLWFIFVGRVSVLDTPEDCLWLREQMLITSRALELKSWGGVRQTLKSFIWIDVANDKAGKRFFDDATKHALA